GRAGQDLLSNVGYGQMKRQQDAYIELAQRNELAESCRDLLQLVTAEVERSQRDEGAEVFRHHLEPVEFEAQRPQTFRQGMRRNGWRHRRRARSKCDGRVVVV